jgi:ubiquinone biosynthesis protein UbiJ
MLSLRTMLDPLRASGLEATVGFRIGPESFLGHLAGGSLPIVAGSFTQADLVLIGEARVIAGWIYGGQTLATLEAAGALRLEGDRALAERFAALFPLPEKAVSPAP